MVFEASPGRSRHGRSGLPNGCDVDANVVELEIAMLRAENAELRKVVIELSKLVVRNVLRNDGRA